MLELGVVVIALLVARGLPILVYAVVDEKIERVLEEMMIGVLRPESV